MPPVEHVCEALHWLRELHQQTDPPLYRAYTDLYSTTDSIARYLLLQSLLRLYMSTTPFLGVCSKSLDSVVNACCIH